jgi:hypothetical protein
MDIARPAYRPVWPAIHRSPLQILCLLVALVLAFALRSNVLSAIYLMLAFAAVLVSLPLLGSMSVRERNVFVVLVAALTAMLPISALRSETAVAHYLGSLASLSLAYVVTRDLKAYRAASRWLLVGAQTAVFAYLSRSGLLGFPLESMLPDSSSNGVTSYLIVLQANYTLVHYLVARRPTYLTVIATLAICIVGYGRGSVLSAAALLTLCVVVGLRTGGQVGRVLKLVGLVIVLGVLWVLYGVVIAALVVENTKLGSGLYDLHRYSILTDYLGRLDAWTFWTGADYAGTSIKSEYNGNPHNSFIRAHHIFGLPYLLVVLAMPVYLARRALPWSMYAVAAFVWLVVLFRAATEPVILPTIFDLFYFSGCFAMGRTLPARFPARTTTVAA